MNKLITLLTIGFLFCSPSCKKEGCMDYEAQNFDRKAIKESGNCEYNANQMAVMKLEGRWKVIQESYNGEEQAPEDFEGYVYLFRECESRSSGCTGNVTYPDPDKGSVSEGFKYSVKDDGKILNIKTDYFDDNYEMTEFTSKILKLELRESANEYHLTLVKL
jgi:hypothetical protein